MIIIPLEGDEKRELRELKKFDISTLETIAQDEAVQKNFFKLDTMENYFKSVVQWNNEKPRDYWGFVIEYKSKVVGFINLLKDELENKADVNFFLGRDYKNKNLRAQALQAIKQFAFQDLHLDSLETRIEPGNADSKVVLLKNGFELSDKGNYDIEKDGITEEYDLYKVFND